jgi:tRNA 2-thiouridine synthesizing protein A
MMISDKTIDTTGLHCPLPVLRTKQALNSLAPGQVLKIIASDPSARRDLEAYSLKIGHVMLDATEDNGRVIIWLKK